jgi:hypothetical protein
MELQYEKNRKRKTRRDRANRADTVRMAILIFKHMKEYLPTAPL